MMKQTTAGATLTFHWGYIILPLIILILSIILTAYFYPRLPGEVAYHFKSDGSPDRWLGRGVVSLWMLIPQLFFTLLATVVTWGITRLSALFKQSESPWIKPEGILLIMGNMVALPQIILGFAMLDIFSYNLYQIHLLSFWVFALIIMGLGAIVLGIFFIRVMRQVWGTNR